METKTPEELECEASPPPGYNGPKDTKSEEGEGFESMAEKFENEENEEDVSSTNRVRLGFVIFAVAVALAVAALIATPIVMTDRGSQSFEETTNYNISQEMLDYYEEQKNKPDEKALLDAERAQILEAEMYESMHLLEMTDEEVAAKYNSTERLYDGRVRRGLQEETVYHEPVCGNTEPSSSCVDLTTGSAMSTAPYVIQCGQCVRVAITDGSTLDFAGGLEIKGKLYFDSTANVVIRTQYIFVFGELKVDLPNVGNQVTFSLYGDAQHSYQALDATAKCGAASCNMGTKAIAVIGGKVDIKGHEDGCPAWEKLIHVGAPVLRDFETPCDATTGACLDLTISGACFESTFHTTAFGKLVVQCPIESTATIVANEKKATKFTSLAPVDKGTWSPPAENFDLTLQYPCINSEFHTNLFNECVLHCPLMGTTAVSTGANEEVIFTSVAPPTPPAQFPPVFLFVVGACTVSQYHVSPTGVHAMVCPLHQTDPGHVPAGHDGPLIFRNDASGAEIAVTEGVHHWAWLGQSIFFFPDASVTLADVNAAFPPYSVITVLSTEPDGQEFGVKRVHHWSWGGSGLFFVPKDYAWYQCGAAATEFNKRFPSGYGIDVSYPDYNTVPAGQTITVSEVIHWAWQGQWLYFAPDATVAEVNQKFASQYRIQVEYTDTYDHNSLIVSAAATNCWKPGTELLLTSHTRYDGDKQVVKVESIGTDSATNLPILVLNSTIERPITLWDSPDYAIEVASLSRRVKFVAESSSYNHLIGGNLIIHNTAAAQSLEGIEIINFGQQGLLGKYPLHFHDCGDSPGSIVKNNVM